jgi:hypothetical protein
MNPVNYVDPFGEFYIPKNHKWSKNSAIVIAEVGDDLKKLAELITGSEIDFSVYGTSNQLEAGQVIDVRPLINIFENNVRGNIVAATNKFRGIFQTRVSSGFSFVDLSESRINKWFDPNSKPGIIECFGAASLIMAKGLIDTLNPREFDALGYTSTSLPTIYETGKKLSELKLGDWTTFRNDPRYRTYWYNKYIKLDKSIVPEEAPFQYENVIKVGDDKFFGFPEKKTKTHQEWRFELAKAFNIVAPIVEKINLNNIPGYIGYNKVLSPVISLDYYSISQSIFMLRNAVKK